MPELKEKSPEDVIRDKFRQLSIHGQRKVVFDSSEDDAEPPEAKPWEARLAALARSQGCRDGLIPEIEDRIKTMDEMMDLASENHSDLAKIVGGRNALRSLVEKLRQLGE